MNKEQLETFKAIWNNIQQQRQEVDRIAFKNDYEDLSWVVSNLDDIGIELENFIGEFEEEVPYPKKQTKEN